MEEDVTGSPSLMKMRKFLISSAWKNGKVARPSADYGKWAAEVASPEQAAFLDLNEIIAKRYEAMGEDKVKELFYGDHTHTNPGGARSNAASVVEGLRALAECPLCRYLRSDPSSR